MDAVFVGYERYVGTDNNKIFVGMASLGMIGEIAVAGPTVAAGKARSLDGM
jgi:hypothetical protein